MIKEDSLISICCLFPYKRMPHEDYPNGYIAELGGAYTKEAYRGLGLMTDLILLVLQNIKTDLPGLDAIVCDSTASANKIYERVGFEYSTEFRQ